MKTIYKITDLQAKLLKEQHNLMEDKVKILRSVAPKMAEAAQKIYDTWEQNEEGEDDIYGGGGICDDIADVMSDIINSNTPFEAVSVYNEHYCHTSVYVKAGNDYFEVDIPPFNYEDGYGYNWKKLPNIKISPDMVSVNTTDEETYNNMLTNY